MSPSFLTSVPSFFRLNFSVAMGGVFSTLILIFITSVFIPNAILTSMKYRSGVLPSLRDKKFKMYRENLIHLTFLVPVVFWSAFAMSAIVFFAISAAVFVIFWRTTRTMIMNLIAIIIGVLITLLIKKLAVFCLGLKGFAAFYRKKPAMVNVASIALECWHIFLAIAFVISRVGILIFNALMFIGRLDRTVLAEDLSMDRYPHVFRQAIVASDAHRHPYIELLGMMYMMKLKHKDNFGKKSASTWRLLFVFALMPWLQKYRIVDADDKAGGDFKVKESLALVKNASNEVSSLKKRIAELETQLEEKGKEDDDLSYDEKHVTLSGDGLEIF